MIPYHLSQAFRLLHRSGFPINKKQNSKQKTAADNYFVWKPMYPNLFACYLFLFMVKLFTAEKTKKIFSKSLIYVRKLR